MEVKPPPRPTHACAYDLAGLERYAAAYHYCTHDLPISFASEPYTRVVLHRDAGVDIVLVCFAAGQVSSVHDHRGSNCVIRLVRGRVLETLFERAADDTLVHALHRYINVGDISGLSGDRIHQISNVDDTGSVLLNFYSPPFGV
jgi:cysteine dioxygenase